MRHTIFYIFILVFSAKSFSQNISSQDTTIIADPQPVVITQEGYEEQRAREERPLKDMSFRERLRIGGGISNLQFGNPTLIGLSPMVGYQASNTTIVGVGGSYIYYKLRFGNLSERFDMVSYRAFVRQDVPFIQQLIGQGFVTAEVEQFKGVRQELNFRPATMLGVGLGMARGFGLTVLYDFNYREGQSLNWNGNTPWVIRVNGFF